MRALAFAVALLVPAAALAQPASPPHPATVCVPWDVMEKLASATATRPWVDVAPLMTELVPVLQHPAPCPKPADAPAPAPPTAIAPSVQPSAP